MDTEAVINQPLSQSELEQIKTKLLQLQETIYFFLRDVQHSPNGAIISWSDMLSKFNLLVAKFVSYNNEINRNPLYKNLLLHPDIAFDDENEIHKLGYLLRTKQLPDIEREEEVLLEEGFPGLKEIDEKTLKDTDIRVLGEIKKRWEERVEVNDHIEQNAIANYNEMLKNFQFKARPTLPFPPKRSSEDNIDPNPKKTEIKSSVKSLDQILGWYSSNRRFDS